MCLSSYQLINSLHESCPILDSKPNLSDEREVEEVPPGDRHACHQMLPPVCYPRFRFRSLCNVFKEGIICFVQLRYDSGVVRVSKFVRRDFRIANIASYLTVTAFDLMVDPRFVVDIVRYDQNISLKNQLLRSNGTVS